MTKRAVYFRKDSAVFVWEEGSEEAREVDGASGKNFESVTEGGVNTGRFALMESYRGLEIVDPEVEGIIDIFYDFFRSANLGRRRAIEKMRRHGPNNRERQILVNIIYQIAIEEMVQAWESLTELGLTPFNTFEELARIIGETDEATSGPIDDSMFVELHLLSHRRRSGYYLL
jgi:hypothetical protein